jgi:hypothetical protein
LFGQSGEEYDGAGQTAGTLVDLYKLLFGNMKGRPGSQSGGEVVARQVVMRLEDTFVNYITQCSRVPPYKLPLNLKNRDESDIKYTLMLICPSSNFNVGLQVPSSTEISPPPRGMNPSHPFRSQH